MSPESIACPYCGSSIPADSALCPACGAGLGSSAADPQPATIVSRPIVPEAVNREPVSETPRFEPEPEPEVFTTPPVDFNPLPPVKKSPNWLVIGVVGCLGLLLLCCLVTVVLSVVFISSGPQMM